MQRLKHIAFGDAAASPHLPPPQEEVRADDLGTLRIPYVPEDFALTQAGAGIPEVGDDEEGDEAAEESPEEHVPELPAPVTIWQSIPAGARTLRSPETFDPAGCSSQ